ncbi:hypothetical protein V6N11_064989 [Hibiscus sabdariffa]|uniref:Uncharacterized protein n=1 Tax=Hibiscus sabdariffa TaxID=183260 RepID=A0ABR2SIM2_9ROSI
MGYAMDADEDEFLVVGERINVAVENEGVGDGHVAPIGTEKVSYANMVVESKGLDEDVARVLGLIDKDVKLPGGAT